MSRNDEFFVAIREDDLGRVTSLLAQEPSLANARIRGDATLLNEQVWENKRVVGMKLDDERDSPALHYAAFHGKTDLARRRFGQALRAGRGTRYAELAQKELDALGG